MFKKLLNFFNQYCFGTVKKKTFNNKKHFDFLLYKLFVRFGKVYAFFSKNSIFKANKHILHDSIRETIWTCVPALILLMLAIPSLWVLYSLDTFELDSPLVTVKVIGHQWYWSYEFVDGNNLNALKNLTISNADSLIIKKFDAYLLPSVNYTESFDSESITFNLLSTDKALNVPILTNIRFLVTSTDVIHSWAIPSLGVKIDAIPGRLNSVTVFIKRAGTFYGQCSEICGINHAFMPIQINAYKIQF